MARPYYDTPLVLFFSLVMFGKLLMSREEVHRLVGLRMFGVRVV